LRHAELVTFQRHPQFGRSTDGIESVSWLFP
jgi:hypothetical protein